uniref:Ferredoxin-thioredoxin reductase catalytic chain, chloroplastic n=1 Tax=Triticum aestivum TaxID=4565 RepID=A0A077RX25_WHEAT|nr:unnamed protein product [Triticum aestivum]
MMTSTLRRHKGSGEGLADHKDRLGAPLCPRRHYDDEAAEAAQRFWNCLCVLMQESCRCSQMLLTTRCKWVPVCCKVNLRWQQTASSWASLTSSSSRQHQGPHTQIEVDTVA